MLGEASLFRGGIRVVCLFVFMGVALAYAVLTAQQRMFDRLQE